MYSVLFLSLGLMNSVFILDNERQRRVVREVASPFRSEYFTICRKAIDSGHSQIETVLALR